MFCKYIKFVNWRDTLILWHSPDWISPKIFLDVRFWTICILLILTQVLTQIFMGAWFLLFNINSDNGICWIQAKLDTRLIELDVTIFLTIIFRVVTVTRYAYPGWRYLHTWSQSFRGFPGTFYCWGISSRRQVIRTLTIRISFDHKVWW